MNASRAACATVALLCLFARPCAGDDPPAPALPAYADEPSYADKPVEWWIEELAKPGNNGAPALVGYDLVTGRGSWLG